MSDFYLHPGDSVSLQKHVDAEAIRVFAELSGDHSPNHVDADAMASSSYGGIIAHGALLVAYMSACSTAIVERVQDIRMHETPVSLGYDRVRFLKPAFPHDTLTLDYTIRETDPVRRRSVATIRVTNQRDELVCIADHILKWVNAT